MVERQKPIHRPELKKQADCFILGSKVCPQKELRRMLCPRWKSRLLTGMLLILSTFTYAQSPPPWNSAGSRFEPVELTNRFAFKTPSNLYKSVDGEIWLSFPDRLLVLQGKQIRQFEAPEQAFAGLSYPHFAQYEGRHFTALENQLYELFFEGERIRLTALQRFEKSFISGLQATEHGLFVLTTRDMYRFDTTTNTIKPLDLAKHSNGQLAKSPVFTYLKVRGDQAMLTNFAGQLTQVNLTEQRLASVVKISPQVKTLIYSFDFLSDQQLLMATNRGAYRYHLGSGQATKHFADDLPGAIEDVVVNGETVWLMHNSRLWQSDLSLSTPRPLTGKRNFALDSDQYQSEMMILDGEGVMWTALKDQGLFRFAPSSQKLDRLIPANPLADGHLNAMLMTQDQIWIANKSGLFNNGEQLIDDAPAASITRHGKHLYAGSLNKVYRVDESGTVVQYDLPSTSYNRTFTNVVVDEKGNLWLSSIQPGLHYYDVQAGKEVSPPPLEHFSADQRLAIRWIAPWGDQSGHFLLFAKDRIYQVKSGQWSEFMLLDSELNRVQVSEAGIYLFFKGGNTRVLRPPVAQLQPVTDAITPFKPACLVQTPQGQTWFVSNEGNLGYLDKDKVQLIGSGQGIPSGGLTGNICQGLDGQLYFSGYNALYRIDPTNIRRNTVKPFITLSNTTLNGKPTTLKDNQAILQSDLPLGIDFFGSSFASPDSNRYRSRLIGLNEQWQYHTATDTKLTFASLPTGQYQLQLQSANNDGLFSDTKQVSFSVLPPLWMRWWAVTGYAVVLILLFFTLHHFRTRQLQARSAKLEALVAKRTSQLAEEKTRVEQLLASREQEFINMSHELRTPLTLIVGPLKGLLGSQLKKYHQIQDRNRLSQRPAPVAYGRPIAAFGKIQNRAGVQPVLPGCRLHHRLSGRFLPFGGPETPYRNRNRQYCSLLRALYPGRVGKSADEPGLQCHQVFARWCYR